MTTQSRCSWSFPQSSELSRCPRPQGPAPPSGPALAPCFGVMEAGQVHLICGPRAHFLPGQGPPCLLRTPTSSLAEGAMEFPCWFPPQPHWKCCLRGSISSTGHTTWGRGTMVAETGADLENCIAGTPPAGLSVAPNPPL